MTNTIGTFETRLKKIDRTRTRLARGYAAKVTRDGLIVFRPKRQQRSVSPRGLAFLFLGVFVFKALILTSLGPVTYETRLQALAEGSIVEQGGAFVMQVDPVTEAIALKLRPFLF